MDKTTETVLQLPYPQDAKPIPPVKGKHVWYLAFGSNMNFHTFQEMRKIKPIRTAVAHVPTAWTSWDIIALPYIEPTFCSILPYDKTLHDRLGDEYKRYVWNRCCPGVPYGGDFPPRMWGVCYLLTEDQWQAVVISEGGWGYKDLEMGYDTIEIECILPNDERVVANTLMGKPGSVGPYLQPSERYVKICREGAKMSGLPSEYQAFWAKLEHFQVKTWRKRLGQIAFMTTFAPFLAFQAWIFSRMKDQRKKALLKDPEAPKFERPPRWAAEVLQWGRKLMIWAHGKIFMPLYGSGYRNDK